jgi:hypothetical protein
MRSDPLQGYRASEDEDLAPGERMLLQLRQEHAGLINLIERSDAMSRWLTTPQGKAWQNEIEQQLNKAMGVLLAHNTLDNEIVRSAHFDARVAVASFKAMERIINAGPELTAKMEAEDRQANAELNSHG